MRINAKVYRILLKVMIAVVAVVMIGVVVFVVMQISGRKRLYGNSDNIRPNLGATEFAETVDEESAQKMVEDNSAVVEKGDSYEWQEGDIRYEGTIYRYNEDVLTFLFLGIDKMTEVKTVKNGIDGGQSDAMFLMVLDPHSKEVSVIGIPRDTMAEIEVYSESGDYLGEDIQQICLQHGYGDGAWLSCERSVNAVSKLFYDLPIHGYCAINMGAIPLINDAVGGVELVALEDVIKSDIKEGETIHLMGESAYEYLHNRDTGSAESADRRLARQKQYLTAYAAKAVETMKGDITLPITLYNTLSKYMVTNITVDEVGYLATQMADYHFSEEQMYSLEGEITFDGRYEQFHADEESLYKLIIDVFYEEVN